LEDGELVARPSPVPLAEWVEERVRPLAPYAAQNRVLLFGRCQPPRAAAHFDRTLVTRAVDVLLGNALAHTPAGGQIALVARMGPDGLTLAIGDTGPRIPAADRDRLFTRYGRLVGEGEP